MSYKAEPMDCESHSELEDVFRLKSYTHSIIPKSIDLTDDQKVMRVPSPEEPYITGIFHRGANQMSNQQAFSMMPSDISVMQQSFYGSAMKSRQRNIKNEDISALQESFYRGTVKRSPTREMKNEEYPTYTIDRTGEMELNSRCLPKKYKCKFCVYKTSYKSDLNRHLRRHAKKDNIYNCDVCSLPFCSISKVFSHRQQCHMTVESDDLSLVCTMCTFRCAEKDLELFQLHVQKHLEDNTCDACNKSFNNPQAVEKHKKIYHQVTNEVVFPPQALRSVDIQYIPETSQSPNQGIQEPDSDLSPAGNSSASTSRDGSCNSTPVPINNSKNSSTMSHAAEVEKYLRSACHEKHHNFEEGNRTKTAIIGNDFSDKAAQKSKNLMDIKSPEKNIPNIGISQKNTDKKADCAEQRTSDINTCKKQYKCEKCSEAFPVLRNLFVHMSVCLQDEVSTKAADGHNCPICNFTTDALQLFTKHIVKHAVDKFSCDICNKPFSKYRNLLIHKRKIHQVDRRRRRAPTKIKFIGYESDKLLKINNSLSTKLSSSSPYTKETIGKITKLANDETETKEDKQTTIIPQPIQEITVTNSSMSGDAPTSGRYVRLVCDMDEFMLKPFACCLCFFRTGDLNELREHVMIHITGSSHDSCPNNIRFNFTTISPQLAKINIRQPVYNINITSPTSPILVSKAEDDVMETASVTSQKEPQNHIKQIKCLENLIKNSKLRRNNNIFLSRSFNKKLPKPKACDICHKEFSMRILAKRHMEKIHNLKK